MTKFVTYIIYTVLILTCVLIVLSLFAVFNFNRISNLLYARMTFGPFSGIERVLASKRWHDQTFGCTYAIVKLTPQRTAELTINKSFIKQFGRFGAVYGVERYWKETPSHPLDENIWANGDLICPYDDIEKNDLKNVQVGLKETGNWVNQSGDYRAFFLPKRNIIGIYRYGD